MQSDETRQPVEEYQVEEGGREGFGERVLSVLMAPREVCARLARRPEWWRALVVVALVTAVAGVLLAGENAAFTRDMMSDVTKVDLTEEQLARMGEVTTGKLVSRAVGGVVWTGVQALLYALVLFLTGRALGGRAGFKVVFSVTSYSCLIGALGTLIMLVVVKLTHAFPVETSLAVLSGGSYLSLTRVALGNVEVFWLWQLVFLTLGLAVVQGFSTGRAAVSTVILFLLRAGVLVLTTAGTRGVLGLA